MKILIAEDDSVSRRILQLTLMKWGYEVITAADGSEAWDLLQVTDAPSLAILDWIMPGLEGDEICRRVRQTPRLAALYILLLTGKGDRQDIVTGLQAGANDYLTKPFDVSELQSRLQVGVRMVELQAQPAGRIKELEAALAQVKQLEGYLPICSYCKKIRDDKNYWRRVEDYISAHSEALFTHSICPGCYQEHVEPELAAFLQQRGVS